MRCLVCEARLDPDDRFCERCGSRTATADDGRLDAPRIELDLGCAAAVSEQGRSHRRNEDAFFLHARSARDAAVVVCDGISSAAAGNIAAQRAAGAAGQVLARAIDGARAGGRESIVAALGAAQEASARVAATAQSDRDAPSCTIVSAICRGGEVVVGWLGDSRAYWLAGGEARQLTVDDSWARAQSELGLLSAEEARRDPRAHAITRWVGGDAPAGPPNIEKLTVVAPGRLIVCTDGLWNYLTGPAELDDLVAALPAGAAPVAIARALTETAIARGGHDDITVAVVDVEPGEASGALGP